MFTVCWDTVLTVRQTIVSKDTVYTVRITFTINFGLLLLLLDYLLHILIHNKWSETCMCFIRQY